MQEDQLTAFQTQSCKCLCQREYKESFGIFIIQVFFLIKYEVIYRPYREGSVEGLAHSIHDHQFFLTHPEVGPNSLPMQN